MNNKFQLSIIVPVYNEENILTSTISDLIRNLKKLPINYEIILVENGSTDDSAEIVDQLVKNNETCQAIHLPKANYGEALKTGYLMSLGKYIANFSIDWIDIDFLKKALKEINRNSIVLASKNLKESQDKRSLLRQLGSKLFHKIINILFNVPVSDTHGLKLLRRDKVIDIVKECKFGQEIFDTELIIRAFYKNLKIKELPVKVRERRISRVNALRRIINSFYQIIKLRLLLMGEER